tara:strand:- start:243 stop:482 length:240 start_codon:yes stop_codon:yes gene_type:complete
MTKEQINNRLSYQIFKDRKYAVQKELFNLTYNFTLKDWRIIQTKKYFIIKDTFSKNWQKNNYLLQCVNYYIKNLQHKNI